MIPRRLAHQRESAHPRSHQTASSGAERFADQGMLCSRHTGLACKGPCQPLAADHREPPAHEGRRSLTCPIARAKPAGDQLAVRLATPSRVHHQPVSLGTSSRFGRAGGNWVQRFSGRGWSPVEDVSRAGGATGGRRSSGRRAGKHRRSLAD